MEHTFWTALDKLVEQSEIIIDRPKGSVHPVHPDFIYQVDYGFLRNTSSMDREGIDIWAGSDHTAGIDAIRLPPAYLPGPGTGIRPALC